MDSNSDGYPPNISKKSRIKQNVKGRSPLIPIIAIGSLAFIVVSAIVLGLIPVYLNSSQTIKSKF
jgi:hypothetical protein